MSHLDQQPTRVIHPLDDVHEQKCSAEGLGPIRMTPAVRFSLRVLRGYLLLMSLMLAYHVLDLSGVTRHLFHTGLHFSPFTSSAQPLKTTT